MLFCAERITKGTICPPFSVRALLKCTSLCTLCSVNLIVPDKGPLSSPRLSHAEEATQADISFWIFIYLSDYRRAFIVLHRQGLSWGLFVCPNAYERKELTLSAHIILLLCFELLSSNGLFAPATFAAHNWCLTERFRIKSIVFKLL